LNIIDVATIYCLKMTFLVSSVHISLILLINWLAGGANANNWLHFFHVILMQSTCNSKSFQPLRLAIIRVLNTQS